MKSSLYLLTFISVFLSSCDKNTINLSDCQIVINEVQFSKSLNEGSKLTNSIAKDSIAINSGAKTDFFNAPNGTEKYANAPMVLKPINNKEPFTFTIKVSPQFSETYDAGAIYMFNNNEKWLKFAFEMDERKLTRIVTVRTNGTSDDNNHDIINEKSVYLKISSDVESIAYYYSIDNVNWQLVKVYKNDFPSETYIGISSQSPLGKGITTTFEYATLAKSAVKDFRLGI